MRVAILNERVGPDDWHPAPGSEFVELDAGDTVAVRRRWYNESPCGGARAADGCRDRAALAPEQGDRLSAGRERRDPGAPIATTGQARNAPSRPSSTPRSPSSRRATAGSWPRSTRKLPTTTASTWRLDTPNGPPMDRERLAAHEAGQAVAAHLMDRVVTMVSLDYAPQVGGSTSPTTFPGPRRKPGVEPCRTHVLHLEAAPTRRRRGRPPRRPRRGKAGARSCRHPRAPRRRPRKPPARPSPRARSARRGSAATGPIQN
jgi:hypothetical protein